MATVNLNLPEPQMIALRSLANGVEKLGRAQERAVRKQRKFPNQETTRAAIDIHNRYCRAIDEYHCALLSCCYEEVAA